MGQKANARRVEKNEARSFCEIYPHEPTEIEFGRADDPR